MSALGNMRPINGGLHAVELSWWVLLLVLLERLVSLVLTVLGQVTLTTATVT